MNKSIGLKRVSAIAISFLLLLAIAAGGAMTIPTYAVSFTYGYTVDVAKAYQEFDGWGLSLSWWATEIGDWTRKGSSGKEKREEIMEAIYGKSGLNLNIARYNVGGGDNPSHTHMTDDRNTPGWRGATLEGEEYVPDSRYFYEDSAGNYIDWQNTPDWRQLWVLDWLQTERNKYGDLLTEYYSNSPPYWMTISGCTSGSVKEGDDLDKKEGLGWTWGHNWNLENNSEHNQAFVEYLLDVYEYLVAQGFTFENIQPFNESGAQYWYWAANGDQEGCHFSAEQQAEILRLLKLEMDKRGIDAEYNVGDETNTDRAVDTYNRIRNNVTTTDGTPGKDVLNGAGRLTYHIYSYNNNNMKRMYHNAHYNNQEIYMSEICWSDGKKYDTSDMTTGFHYVDSIIDTVKYGGVDAYVFWQGMEDMIGQMKSGTNYGLIQGVYYTQEEAEAQGVDLAAMGLKHQDFVLSKAYYLSGQYTKYIEKGYRLVEIDDARTMAAISPDGKTLVIVKENKGDSSASFRISLNGFKAGSVEKVYTDETHDWARASVATTGNYIYDTVGKKSVTTYIVHGTRTGRVGHFIDDSEADDGLHDGTSVYTLDQIKAKIEERGEVEGSYATYDIMGSWGGDYGYFGSTSKNATEGQYYQVYHFKGVGFAIAAPIKGDLGAFDVWIDADPASAAKTTTVSLNSNVAFSTAVVYENKTLSDEWHTVYVKAVSAGGKNWANFDGIYVYEALDEESENVLYISNAEGVGGVLNFNYVVMGYSGYKFYLEHRAVGEVKWERETTELSGMEGSIEVDSETVELRIVAVKDDYEEYSPVYVAKILNTTEGVLYFVDCGTANQSELATGAVLGEYQSSSDKQYGADGVTGKKWGYTNEMKAGEAEKGYYVSGDAMSSVMSTEKFNEDYLEYKFDITDAGTYKIALGFFGGGSTWGTRNESVTVTYNGSATQSSDIAVQENVYNALYYSLALNASSELSIKVEKKAEESQAPMLSLIVITKEGTKLPLYTSGTSSYNSEAAVTSLGNVTVGEDLFEKYESSEVTLYFSDNTTDTINGDDADVSIVAETIKIAAGNAATATIVSEKYEGLEAYITYTWYQEGARELYYNIDIGNVGDAVPDDATLLGSKQSTTKDRKFEVDSAKGTSWGLTKGAASDWKSGTYWESGEPNEWSIRESKTSDPLTYKMTGFEPNEDLELITGGHNSNGWGARSYAVKVNGTEQEERIVYDNTDARVYLTYEVKADANGELEVAYVKKSGDNPLVGYIMVYSSGANLPRGATIAADKAAAGLDGEITLRNLNPEGVVYVIDEDGKLYGNFKPTSATQTISLSDYVPEGVYSVQFVQAAVGENVSLPLTIDIPAISFNFDNVNFVREGDAVVITFKPLVSKGVTSLSLTLPGGKVSVDILAEGFFYRATQNGDYTITLVSNGVTTTGEFTIDTLDVVTFGISYSTTAWTAGSVTVTADPKALSGKSGIAKVEIAEAEDGKEYAELDFNDMTYADDKYTVTATENKDYVLKITTTVGNEYYKEVSVKNIDKSEASVDVKIDFKAANGVTLQYESHNASGGVLKVKYGDGEAEEVVDGMLVDLAKEGKYTISYVAGNGKEIATVATYYVTYGVEKANLASVTLGEDGTVTVSEKTRAVPEYKLYKAGSGEEAPKANKAGRYYLEITAGDETEIIVINIEAQANEIVDKTQTNNKPTTNNNGSVGGMVAGIIIGVLALIAAAVVCPLILIGKIVMRRKGA